MEIYNLFALAEDRRIAREREARLERLRRRKPPAETVTRAVKPRCGGTVDQHPARV